MDTATTSCAMVDAINNGIDALMTVAIVWIVAWVIFK